MSIKRDYANNTALPFSNTDEIQIALTEAEGLIAMALHCLRDTDDNKPMLGGIDTALVKALNNVKATGKALDGVNVHKLAEFNGEVVA